MSSGGASAARSFAFGDLASGLWGAAWGAEAGQATVVLGQADVVVVLAATPVDASAVGEWSFAIGDGNLTLEPVGPAVEGTGNGDDGQGLDQLCRARGRLSLEGTERELDCPGWRQVRALLDQPWATVRQVAAWFADGQGLALTALRPRDASEHDRDLLSAALFGEEGAAAVEDPRLSTTYAADGRPTGAGVELWLPEPEGEELYPLRAAGEAVGPEATWSQEGVELRAELFCWHSRGREGAGVYLLGQRP